MIKTKLERNFFKNGKHLNSDNVLTELGISHMHGQAISQGIG